MSSILKVTGLAIALTLAFQVSASDAPGTVLSESAMNKLKGIGLSIEHIEESPVKDIYAVVSREGTSYVSKDGDYIFSGNLFRVNGKEVENITAQAVLKAVREFAAKTKTIQYKSPTEKYQLAIFTDITCGYCQKLHHDLKSYQAAGISIKFLAFPRAGLNSVVAENMAKIWCAANPNKALDEAMASSSSLPVGRADAACLDFVKAHYQIASTIPLQGTPTMVTLSGEPQVFTGWLSPENIVARMGETKK